MNYCLYNAIKTPDGTILWCQNNHDYKSHKDKVSGEDYMTDGIGYSIRRSVNKVPYEDLSISTSDTFEKIRTAKFWASFGKDGKSPKTILSLEEMEKEHIEAILRTQTQIKGTEIQKIFIQELEYRAKQLYDKIDNKIAPKAHVNQPKI